MAIKYVSVALIFVVVVVVVVVVVFVFFLDKQKTFGNNPIVCKFKKTT